MTKLNLKRIFAFFLLTAIGICLISCAKLSESLTANQPQKKSTEIHNVSVLLPLEDHDVGTSSKAIRDGILAAYYADSKNSKGLNIKIIDSTNKNILALYNQAIAEKADFVIGPLTKKDVNTLASLNTLPIPTLALNTLDNYKTRVIPNLYQFGLLPQDEAAQIASKMTANGIKRTEIIVLNNAWSKKIAATFSEQYKNLGGQITSILYYNEVSDLDEEIKNSMQNNSDGIFLITSPENGRQIVPLLKFYYTSNLPPIYSISQIYTGTPKPNLDQDLDGVIFCDTPWTIASLENLPPRIQRIHGQVTTEWLNAFENNSRLYALGADSYHIAIYFNNLIKSHYVKINGATGILNIDKYNHIYRELKFAKFENGTPSEF